MFNKNVDFFGMWDLIAFNDGHWLLVQVNTDFRNKVWGDLSQWMDMNEPPFTIGLYAIRSKGKKWELASAGGSIVFDFEGFVKNIREYEKLKNIRSLNVSMKKGST